jgi:hypothetical protein
VAPLQVPFPRSPSLPAPQSVADTVAPFLRFTSSCSGPVIARRSVPVLGVSQHRRTGNALRSAWPATVVNHRKGDSTYLLIVTRPVREVDLDLRVALFLWQPDDGYPRESLRDLSIRY